MANMLQLGTDWLARKLKQHADETLVYSRGAQSVTITGTLGKTLMRLESADGGARMEWTDADVIVEAADLVLGGVMVKPESGDKIRWSKGGVTRVFEVLPYGNEPCWRWSDDHQTILRIRTKQVDTE